MAVVKTLDSMYKDIYLISEANSVLSIFVNDKCRGAKSRRQKYLSKSKYFLQWSNAWI